MNVSALICCRNDAENIEGLLANIDGYVDEIVVVDGESTDETLRICLEYGAKIYSRPPQGWPEPDRNFCMSKARNRWVLFLDADERCSDFLLSTLDILTDDIAGVTGFYIPRRNYYAPDKYYRHVHYPDYQLRLFDRDYACWPTGLHTSPVVVGNTLRLYEPHHIKHYDPVYSDRAKYDRWAEVHAGQYPLSFPPMAYRIAAPFRYAATMIKDAPALFDGAEGVRAALDHARYDYLVYKKIGEKR